MSTLLRISSYNTNIGHFLHESLDQLLQILRNNTQCILLITDNLHTSNDLRWHSGIIKCLESEVDSFSTKKMNNSNKNLDCLIINPQHPSKINVDNLFYLRNIIFKHFKINDKLEDTYKVFYTRIQDTNRRHVYNYKSIENNVDLVVHSLNISFDENVKLFSKCSHFISVEGASFTNIIFMKSDAKMMAISTRTDYLDRSHNSWQVMFGSYKLIKEFNIKSKATERIRCNIKENQDFHDHIKITNDLKEDILKFIE
tara:strand:+ start:336 stop:1103 length:768 start_codon:yes stop_codon:yes gene_type:complete